MVAAAAAVEQRIGETVVPQHYGHTYCPTWKVVTDGSLGDYRRGCEFVSPKLQGEAGLAQLEKVCEALTDFGCTVSRQAGFHVHVGAAGQPMSFFRKLVKLYQAYEPIIDGFMPASRRGSGNSYCRSLAAIPAAQIDQARTPLELASLIGRHSRAMEARYHKLNLASMARHGTVEFRQHSGTIDGRKACNWVLTCLRMVETAKGEVAFGNGAARQINTARPGSKAHQIGQMLLRPEGTTGPEICQIMGWPSVSVPAQARAAGLEVYTQRTGRVVRYFVRQPQAETTSAALVISLEGFCNLIKAFDGEREYLRTRTTNLGGTAAWTT
jgi:hypothetical protein